MLVWHLSSAARLGYGPKPLLPSTQRDVESVRFARQYTQSSSPSQALSSAQHFSCMQEKHCSMPTPAPRFVVAQVAAGVVPDELLELPELFEPLDPPLLDELEPGAGSCVVSQAARQRVTARRVTILAHLLMLLFGKITRSGRVATRYARLDEPSETPRQSARRLEFWLRFGDVPRAYVRRHKRNGASSPARFRRSRGARAIFAHACRGCTIVSRLIP